MAEIVCQMMFRRFGEAEYRHAEVQHRTRMPAHGDLVEITVDSNPVLGRVASVTAEVGTAATVWVHVDEIGR